MATRTAKPVLLSELSKHFMTAERKASAREIAKASNALAQQAQKMQEALMVFKV